MKLHLHKGLWLTASVCLTLGFAAMVLADIFRVEFGSSDGRRATKRFDQRILSARLVRQQSSSPCVYGRTWGYNDYSMWADDGCRGIFEVETEEGRWSNHSSDDNHKGWKNEKWHWIPNERVEVRVESLNGKRTRFIGQTQRARLIRTLSATPCERNYSYGIRDGEIWTDRGCRGVFEVYVSPRGDFFGHEITLESLEDNRQSYPINTSNGVELVRRISKRPCERNRSWGTDRRGIWVDDGCRGIFRVWYAN